ncbi:hypothetical protein EG68_08379 [Paragonimus skrjabini miyazakii]|uniref:Uncharacterized protein n=1 Tax=Paragonimus skrjabini miyazakii TaxID=59628 RepID=A0A8S9YVB2_9TREM|nr:hypothetical protein EG68_08379 [Paragonimus skrjabini miyazakii]
MGWLRSAELFLKMFSSPVKSARLAGCEFHSFFRVNTVSSNLTWDTDLEIKAQTLADQCQCDSQSIADRSVTSYDYVGQNVAAADNVTGLPIFHAFLFSIDQSVYPTECSELSQQTFHVNSRV